MVLGQWLIHLQKIEFGPLDHIEIMHIEINSKLIKVNSGWGKE